MSARTGISLLSYPFVKRWKTQDYFFCTEEKYCACSTKWFYVYCTKFSWASSFSLIYSGPSILLTRFEFILGIITTIFSLKLSPKTLFGSTLLQTTSWICHTYRYLELNFLDFKRERRKSLLRRDLYDQGYVYSSNLRMLRTVSRHKLFTRYWLISWWNFFEKTKK